MRVLRLLIIIICLTSVAAGCASKKKRSAEDLAQQQVEELYSKGKNAMDKGNYTFAIDYYKALEANFPFGPYTEQAKLDMIYSYDKINQTEEAVEAAENFIKLYPTHQNIDYAYYMKGVVNFEKKLTKIDKFIKGGNRSLRDPKPLRDSESAFTELIKRFPQSVYVEDAKQRIVYLNNLLADRELQVAHYYYDHKTYVATLNRCKNIIYQFETTPAVEGALVLMEKTYLKMGMNELASSTHAVLVENFPNYQAGKPAELKKKSFFKRVFSRKEPNKAAEPKKPGFFKRTLSRITGK